MTNEVRPASLERRSDHETHRDARPSLTVARALAILHARMDHDADVARQAGAGIPRAVARGTVQNKAPA
jgi:hypothetical protein